MKKKVKGEGPKDANLVIVGEAPGKTEVKKGRPFVGWAGSMLDSWLEAAGIQRSECYLDNIMHVRPPGNKFSLFYKKKNRPALEDGRKRLKRTLNEIKPNCILLLGNEPLKALLNHGKITKWRGSIVPSAWGKVVPTVHPSFVIRGQRSPYTALAMRDVSRAKEESQYPEYKEPYRWSDLEVVKTAERAVSLLKQAQEADRLAIDIETPRPTRFPYVFGFADSWNHAVSISFMKGTKHRFRPEVELKIWGEINQLLKTKIPKVAQRGIFDFGVLEELGITVNNYYLDTMYAQAVACPEIPKDLDTLTSIYTRIPYYAYLSGGKGDQPYYYNALDCLSTYRCSFGLEKELRAQRNEKYYFSVKHPVIRVAMDMQQRGIRCDHEKREERIKKLQDKMEAQEKALTERAISKIREKLQSNLGEEKLERVNWLFNKVDDEGVLNANSPKQLKIYLYDVLGFKPRKNRSTGRVTTNEDALEAVSRKTDDPSLDQILTIRYLQKLLSTYLEANFDETKRWKTSYDVSKAPTTRWSSGKRLDNIGLNLQNIPREFMRDLFLPDPELILIAADYSQIESRIVAWLANEPTMKEVFLTGKDIHRYVASQIFGIPQEEVTKKQRFKGKTVEHAGNYKVGKRKYAQAVSEFKGIGPDGLPEKKIKRKMSEKKAQRFLNDYYSTFMRIKVWHREVGDTIRRTRVLENPLGLRRIFFGSARNNKTIRKAINHVPQSTVAGLIDMALVNLYWSLPPSADLLHQNHDEIVLQCREEQKHEIRDLVRRAMEFTIMDDLECIVDVEAGENWQNTEEI